MCISIFKKSLKLPNGKSEAVIRKTFNSMAKRPNNGQKKNTTQNTID